MASLPNNSAMPSPTASSSLPSIGVRLNNSNYLLWRTRFMPLLRAYQLLDFVKGTSTCPPSAVPATSSSSDVSSGAPVTTPVNSAFTAWVLRDQLALGWILQSIEDFIVPLLIDASTSHAAWSILERNYALQNQAWVMQLHNEFQSLTKGASSMTEYLTKAKIIIDSLNAIGRPLSPDEIISRALFGLRLEYSTFRSVLNVTGFIHNFDSLHGILLTEEAYHLLELPSGPMVHVAALPRPDLPSPRPPPPLSLMLQAAPPTPQ